MTNEKSPCWYGYTPTDSPGFTAPENTELFWCRIYRQTYCQDQLPKMERVTIAEGYLFPSTDQAPEILEIKASWFEDGLPEENTPFLLWANEEFGFFKAVPLAYWVGYNYGGWLSACYHKNKRPKLWTRYVCDIPSSKFTGKTEGHIIAQKGKQLLVLREFPLAESNQPSSFYFEGPKVKDLKSIQVWVNYWKELGEDSDDIPELEDHHERLLATNLREAKQDLNATI